MTLVSRDQDSQINVLKARVAALEEQVADLQVNQLAEAEPESVIFLRTITKNEARVEIVDLFNSSDGPVYYSDIMEKLGIELDLLVEICGELIEEGVVGLDGDTV